MTLFRNLLIGCCFMLTAVYVAANMMDANWQVTAETTITTRSTARLDEKLVNAKAWEEWMYANPTNFKLMKFSYLDKLEGVGATQRWRDGPDSSSEEGIRTLDVFDDERVVYKVRHGTFHYTEEIRIEPTDTGYRLKMRVYGQHGPMSRLVFWMFNQKHMQQSYAAGLDKLKEVIEK